MAVGSTTDHSTINAGSGISFPRASSPPNRVPTPPPCPDISSRTSLEGRVTNPVAPSVPISSLSDYYLSQKQKIEQIRSSLPSGFISSDLYNEHNRTLVNASSPINMALVQDSIKKQKDPEKFILSAHISTVQALLSLDNEDQSGKTAKPHFETALDLLKVAFEEIRKVSDPELKKVLLLQEMLPLYRLLKDSPAYRNENLKRHIQEYCSAQIELILKLTQAKLGKEAQSYFEEIFKKEIFEVISLDQQVSLLGLKAALITFQPYFTWGKTEIDLISLVESSLSALKQENASLFSEKSQLFRQALSSIISQIDPSQSELRTSLSQLRDRYSSDVIVPKDIPSQKSGPNFFLIGMIALSALALIALVYRNWKRRG